MAALAALGLAGIHPAQAQTVVITGASASGNPGTSLTTVGTTDWAKWGVGSNDTTFVNKSATGVAGGPPVGDISNLTAIAGQVPGGPGSPNVAISDSFPSLSWTDGSSASYDQSDSQTVGLQNASYASNTHCGLGMGWTFTVIVPAQQTGTFYLYEGGYNSTDTLSVTSSDGTASSMMTVDNANGTGYFTAAINNTAAASDTLSFSFYESGADGTYDNPKISAATLSLSPAAAPEPSAAAVLVIGLLGLAGQGLIARKRRPTGVTAN